MTTNREALLAIGWATHTASFALRTLNLDPDAEVATPPRPTPLSDRWVNLYDRDSILSSRHAADKFAVDGRLAVLHVWTDDDGVDHADIERVAK